MVGPDAPVTRGTPSRTYRLSEILSEKHIQVIIKKVMKADSRQYSVVGGEACAASDGLAGFLGEHVRVVLHVQHRASCPASDTAITTLRLFVKRVPHNNQPKADYIRQNDYFKRENFMLQLLEEMGAAEGDNPWCVQSLVRSDSMVVMPDLACAGYATRPTLEPLDLPHALLAATAIARFHASFANYDTAGTGAVEFHRERGHMLGETFKDSPWVRAAAKLTADFLDAFSTKYGRLDRPHLEEDLARLYVAACDSLHAPEGTLNVVLHKDLWINNVLFKYKEGAPTGALLIDYQCVGFGPPAFDVTAFLWLTTTRAFREEHETRVLRHYYSAFTAALEESTCRRLAALGYTEVEFQRWCARSRMFALFEANAFFPQVLMDARAAQRVFDDPATFVNLVERDRSRPVLDYAARHPLYRDRNLEVAEEFVERYLIQST